MKKLVAPLVALIMLAVIATPAAADGIVVPREVTAPPLAIKYHRVQVQITDQVASTNVDQVFVNDWNQECEGTYIFPIPESAAISDFTMEVDGKTLEGRLLDKDEARRIYESIVRQRQDPALLEYVGRNAFQASVYPIPPHGERRIQIGYNEILRADGDMIYYRYPLNTEKFSARPIEDVSVVVRVQASRDIQAVYSPSHDIATHRIDARTVEVNYETRNESPDKDFELYYVLGEGAISTSLMTYRDLDGEGFFLLLLAPPPTEPTAVVDKDVIFILDTSGSMRGEKLAQAQSALRFILDNLNPGDRFNIVSFNSSVSAYAEGLVAAAQAGDARRYVDRLQATGGTNIDGALTAALKLTDEDSSRPQVLIFLTDGLPTEGVTEIEQILSNIETAAPDNARLFPFGVGDDVNTVLLDTLAEQHRGTTGYVRPHERIDEEVSGFYSKISTPVLADIELDVSGVLVEDTYPYPLPDLFAGTQLILTGRYRDSGATRITLTGKVNGETQEFVYEGNFRAEGGDSFIPRLWATRKIGYLLTQIRLHGEREEWVDAIVELSVRYGIITPYTSFLIEEDDILTEQGREEAADEYLEMPAPPAFGAPAAEKAELEGELRGAESGGGWAMPEEAAQVVRLVGSKTFLLQDGVWIDTTFDPSRMSTTQVGFGSDDYFDLLAARPEWGAYFALGERVIFLAEGTAYEVVEGEGGPV
ncbi:MAG: VWA domain-containing protein, partial [Chloroflexi bacterium]|nr:VWA domain-containing protein [Chloroflexota bacterium]